MRGHFGALGMSWSSFFHTTVGVGEPVNVQLRVRFVLTAHLSKAPAGIVGVSVTTGVLSAEMKNSSTYFATLSHSLHFSH